MTHRLKRRQSWPQVLHRLREATQILSGTLALKQLWPQDQELSHEVKRRMWGREEGGIETFQGTPGQWGWERDRSPVGALMSHPHGFSTS